MNNISSHTYMLLQRMSQDIHTNMQLLFFPYSSSEQTDTDTPLFIACIV